MRYFFKVSLRSLKCQSKLTLSSAIPCNRGRFLPKVSKMSLFPKKEKKRKNREGETIRIQYIDLTIN